jgi:hypothetical protein
MCIKLKQFREMQNKELYDLYRPPGNINTMINKNLLRAGCAAGIFKNKVLCDLYKSLSYTKVMKNMVIMGWLCS